MQSNDLSDYLASGFGIDLIALIFRHVSTTNERDEQAAFLDGVSAFLDDQNPRVIPPSYTKDSSTWQRDLETFKATRRNRLPSGIDDLRTLRHVCEVAVRKLNEISANLSVTEELFPTWAERDSASLMPFVSRFLQELWGKATKFPIAGRPAAPDFEYLTRRAALRCLLDMIKWCDDGGEAGLSDSKCYILEALLELEATSPEKRKTAARIVNVAFSGQASPNSYKRVLLDLVEQRLIGSKGGPRGGYWLRKKGLTVAKRLKAGKS